MGEHVIRYGVTERERKRKTQILYPNPPHLPVQAHQLRAPASAGARPLVGALVLAGHGTGRGDVVADLLPRLPHAAHRADQRTR